MILPPRKQTRIKTSLPYCLYKIDTRFFKLGDSENTKIRFTKQETTPNRRTSASKNVEAIRDRWGIEAHSDVEIYTDKVFPQLDDARQFTVKTVNDFVKRYRYHDTQAVHLVPIIEEDLDMFNSIGPDGLGAVALSFGGGITIYNPMQTQRISDAVDKAITAKEAIPFWSELLLNAEQYLYQGERRHSVLESVIALELVLSEFLSKACAAKGISTAEADKYITDIGLTGNIKVTLRLVLDPAITLDDEVLEKCKAAITIRNAVVHKGRKEVSEIEAESTLTNIRKLIELVRGAIITPSPSDHSAPAHS